MKKQNFIVLRRVIYSFVIVGMLCSAFYINKVPTAYAQALAAEQSTVDSQTAGTSEVLVNLSTDQLSFDTLEDVILHVAITNPNLEAVQVLKWLTPADGMGESVFVVTRDGEPVHYLGAVYKRLAPTEQDYLRLQPGETLSGDINLSAYYDLSVSGNYTVTYDIASPELYAVQEKRLSKVNGRLTSNSVKLFLEGHAMPELKNFTPQVVTGSTGFTGCSGSQQSLLLNARANASIYADGSLGYLNAGNPGIRYTTWFGVYDSSRYNSVRNHFTNIKNAMDTAAVNFNCSCQESFFAYVYPSQPYNIYLCQGFWGAPMTGTDSKAGTLIHEMSHFTIVAATNDWVYGQNGARNLALSEPNQAVDNADNHEYFAENNPPSVEVDAYEVDNTAGQAKWINSGSPQTHSIVPTNDLDWVKFQLTNPSAVVLETSGPTDSDTRMWLYNSGLTQINHNDDISTDNNYSHISTCTDASPLLPAGTYYVKIDEFGNNNEIPSYQISLMIGCPSLFNDVQTDYWARNFIERLYIAGITGGCGVSPLNYCPETIVTRSQMAVFLERGIHGSSYSPPAVGSSTGFGDVAVGYWAAAWIKQLAAEGITGGCGNGNYCPEYAVTRDQMAVFLLRSKYGAGYSPPPVGGSTGFGDVPIDHWAAPWIKQLVTEGITAGCGSGNYCPTYPVTRAQMAVFLVRTFNLP
jgi:peptidyl-Lys metalloendopeptidase